MLSNVVEGHCPACNSQNLCLVELEKVQCGECFEVFSLEKYGDLFELNQHDLHEDS